MGADIGEPKHELTFAGAVRFIREEDVIRLQPILETWIRDRITHELLSDEVTGLMGSMRDSINGINDRIYLVAEGLDGQLAGVVGFKNPDETMRAFAETENPAELVNAYVAHDQRNGRGVGSALVRSLEKEAIRRGYTEIILNSGPRYKETGWGFYDKQPGYKRVGIAEQMYGVNGDAPVWNKVLSKTS